MKTVIAALYLAGGLVTASVVAEVHHQVCTPNSVGAYVVVGAAWPLFGALAVYKVATGDHAESRCRP